MKINKKHKIKLKKFGKGLLETGKKIQRGAQKIEKSKKKHRKIISEFQTINEDFLDEMIGTKKRKGRRKNELDLW